MIYEFGPFRLDSIERLLLRGTERVSLTKKEFDLLLKFVENSEKLLSRNKLNRTLWPEDGQNVSQTDSNLDKYVSNLRKKLEDTEGRSIFKNEPKEGYRFLMPVRELESNPSKEVPNYSTDDEFKWLIDKSTAGFIGREYVFTAIQQFINDQPSGYIIIQDDPGIGKTAILAEWVRRNHSIAFFNIRSMAINSAEQFLVSVCRQLISRYGLPYNEPVSNETHSGDFLSKLLAEARSKLEAKEKIIIAVDALDEVNLDGQPDGSNVLYLPKVLPEGVYFVMTRRRQVHLPFTSQAAQKIIDLLIDYPVESRRDIRAYIENALNRPRLRLWVDQTGVGDAKFVGALAEKSENNFMYLYYVLPEIEYGTYQDLNIEKLPVGLEGYYMDHWRVMGMMDRPLNRSKLKIVYVLAEVLQPVSRRLIAKLTNEDGLTVQEVLDEWLQFLHEQIIDATKRYSVYHSSFRDFLHLQDVLQAAEVTIRGINELIADSLWDIVYGDSDDPDDPDD